MNTLQQLLIGLSLTICVGNLPMIANSILASTQSNSSTQISVAAPTTPDRVIGSRTIFGYFTHLVWGDYFHAFVKTDRETIDFIIDRNEDCFLALYPKSRLKIKYDLVKRYIPEATGYQTIKIISNIETNQTNLIKWRKSMTPIALKQCDRLVKQATRSN
jgi:hypothetical protein